MSLLATAKVDDDLSLSITVFPQEFTDRDIDNVQSEVIASIDEGSPPLELLDEIAEEVRLIGVIQLLDASFRDNTAVVRLDKMSVGCSWNGYHIVLTPMTWSS